MKTILLINNNTPEARHAGAFALKLAAQLQAEIIIANNYVKANESVEKVLVGRKPGVEKEQTGGDDLKRYLQQHGEQGSGYEPIISEIDITGMHAGAVAQMVNDNRVWMMIKGLPEETGAACQEVQLDAHTLLNKVLCPIMLVPENWQIKDVERIVYMADLRYCRIHVVRYLTEWAKPGDLTVSIAHISAKGLPDMMEPYATEVFSEEVFGTVKYDKLLFNNIKERDIKKAVDVLVNGLHNDVVVIVNHRFHFEEILGRYITESLPGHVSAPLLVFPY